MWAPPTIDSTVIDVLASCWCAATDETMLTGAARSHYDLDRVFWQRQPIHDDRRYRTVVVEFYLLKVERRGARGSLRKLDRRHAGPFLITGSTDFDELERSEKSIDFIDLTGNRC